MHELQPASLDQQATDQTTEEPGQARTRSMLAKLKAFIKNPERKWSAGISSLVAALPALLLGLTLGYPSNAILDLTGEATELPEEFFFSSALLSLFAALAPAAAVIGGPVGGWIADRIGRKWSMMLCGGPYFAGYMLLSFAHHTSSVPAFNFLLMTGRSLTGVGMGWASAVSPVYTAELCSATLRGIYGNVFPIFLTSGLLFNYALGAIPDFRYYYISLVAVGIVVLFWLLMVWLPETPRWLLSSGRRSCFLQSDKGERAKSVLQWLRGKNVDITGELNEIKNSASETEAKIWKLFLKRSVLIPVAYLLVIFAMQQAGGINAITPFAGTILSDAGVSSPRATAIYAVGASGIAGFTLSIILVEILERKCLLIISGIGQFLGALLLGIHAILTRPSLCDSSLATNSSGVAINSSGMFMNSSAMGPDNIVDAACNPELQYLVFFSIILFVFIFTLGYNSIPFILLSELLPLSVRGVASGMASAMAWFCAALFTGFYFELSNKITPWITLWGIAVLDIATVVFVLVFIPNTKGRRLEDLQYLFAESPCSKANIVENILSSCNTPCCQVNRRESSQI
jgi:MFS family permease